MKNLSQFSDSELYSICKKWGREALAARRRFAGLLPEVYRREMQSKGIVTEPADRTQAEFKNGKSAWQQMETPDRSIGWQKSASVIAESDQQKITAKIVHSPGHFLPLPQNPPRKSWLERRGYTCLYEFAARLAGMSRKQVDLILRLDQGFADTPVLHAALVEGKISANKLARVASIATGENQNELLRKTEILSSRALEIYVRELKMENGHTGAVGLENDCADGLASQFENQSEKGNANGNTTENETLNGFIQAKFAQKVMHVHHFDAREKDDEIKDETTGAVNASTTDATHETKAKTTDAANGAPIDATHDTATATTTDTDILAAFSPELKQKIRELKAKGIDVNNIFMEFLQKRETEIQEEMEKLGREQLQVRLEKHIIGKPASRHMSAKIKRIIRAQHGHVCSEAGCTKPAAHIHHQKPFALFGSHDPRHLRPLCKAHHELAHAGEYVGFRGAG